MSFCHKILEEIHPVLYRDIMNNVFTIFLTIQPFTRIICDRVIEMAIDKLSKSAGGLPRITENKYVSERWMRINHVMVALTHKLDDVIRKGTISFHIDFGGKRTNVNEQDVKAFVDTLTEWVPSP